ncbi:DUF6049 family protein [Sporichthya polymorpha]|uniref:DUF6049 family protein n=1 Tax=Sporichthya polymorpha TaxID=35751 RepID=UPI0012EBC2ED|nr:DUF6049 family protein [Sporichthya polymorpha]
MSARWRRAPAVVTAIALLVGGVAPALLGGATAGASSGVADVRTAAANQDGRLELTSISPVAPRPAGRVTVRGNLVNPGGDAFSDLSIGLRVSTAPLTSRGDLAAIAGGSDERRSMRTVPGATRIPGEVTSGRVSPWQVSVPARQLRLPGNGVYILEVRASGRVGNGELRELATLTTFLPFLPNAEGYSPTKLTWIWPLVGTPARDAHGVFLPGTSNAELLPGGRLADLAVAPDRVPVTWMVDPELLDSAAALSAEHERQEGRGTTTQEGDPAAGRWLADLRTRLANTPVAALPYADPDVVALTRHGDPDALAKAVARSKEVTGARLGRESDTTVAWPADGFADARTLGALRRAGAKTVVLSSSALMLATERTYTPTGRARIEAEDGSLEVLVADQGLIETLSVDFGVPGAAALAAQRFLAETALITLERPNAARTILVAPPRRWAPPAGWSAGLLDAVERTPWVRTVGLASLSRTRVPTEYAGASLVYPPSATAAELAAAQVARMEQAADAADGLVRLFARPGGLETTYTGALFSAVSTAWRTNRSGGRDYALAVSDRISSDIDQVQVIGRDLVTLSSTRGTIPLTVSNQLDQAIRVRPVLRPRVGSRLSVTNPDLITIGAGRKQTVRVPAEASSNGITQVDVQLLDAAGNPFGDTTQLRVNVTSFGKVGLIVLIAAGSVLFGTAILRNVRRLRRPAA